ncbi:hypothetical protein, partial [Thiohalocapsa marina]|uniref:hypothetical protein n=1 Tax=Thiohalocapsa marina TaxID=424902 RepID=UPI001B885A0A
NGNGRLHFVRPVPGAHPFGAALTGVKNRSRRFFHRLALRSVTSHATPASSAMSVVSPLVRSSMSIPVSRISTLSAPHPLSFDIVFCRFPLRIQRVELLFETFLGNFITILNEIFSLYY